MLLATIARVGLGDFLLQNTRIGLLPRNMNARALDRTERTCLNLTGLVKRTLVLEVVRLGD